MPWAEEVIEQLKGLAAQGYSASQAANQIPGMTRNGAVGLAFRKGFHFLGTAGGRGGGARTVNRSPSDPHATPTRRQIVAKVLAEPVVDLQPFLITFDELNLSNDCKYPHGDTDFRFCGLPALENLPYCKRHCQIAYRPPEHRR